MRSHSDRTDRDSGRLDLLETIYSNLVDAPGQSAATDLAIRLKPDTVDIPNGELP